MESSLETLLEILSDDTQDIPIDDLTHLSDLDQEGFALFAKAWPYLSVPRKQALVLQLGELADANIELSHHPIFLVGLKDDDPEVRQNSILNLWEYDDPGLVPELVQALENDPAPQVRAAAASALGNFLLFGAIRDLSPELMEQIELCLVAGLKDHATPEIRQNCIASLGYSPSASFTEIIENAYASADEGLKLAAIIAMGRTLNRKWTPIIIKELFNHSPLIRAEAARSAGELEARETIESLIDLIDDVDVAVKVNSIWALGQIGGDRAENAFEVFDASLEDDEVVTALAEAVEHLAFVNETRDYIVLDIDQSEDSSN